MKSLIRHIIVLILSLSLYSLASFSYAAEDTTVKQGSKEKVQSVLIKNKKQENEIKIKDNGNNATNEGKSIDNSGDLQVMDEKDIQMNDSSNSGNLSKLEEEKIKNELNTLFINSMKPRINKTIKDLDNRIDSITTNIDEKIEFYSKIKLVYEIRRKAIKSGDEKEIRKAILLGSLDYIIYLLDQRINKLNLEK